MEGKMKIQKFEDMQVWQDARMLVNLVYTSCSTKSFAKDYGLKDQIQRASVSIMSNIAEGYERDSNKEMNRFLNFSKGSAGEVRSLLYVAYDLNYITEEEFRVQYDHSISIIKQIANFIKYLKKREN